jgi:phosphoglycolate phosphatase
MPTPIRLVWLFDIDGTLLLTEGAAREAFAFAVRERLGIADDLADIRFDGRTEPLIVADILVKHGLSFGNGDEARFFDAVFERMRRTLVPPRGRLLAGVPQLLDRVGAEPAWLAALLTGNMTEMARIKLARFGLEGRFAFGAFGEEAADRNSLARVAVSRAAGYGVPPSRCLVVGDTEHDIVCARAAGARAVAVATGVCRRETLEAHHPDLLLDSLADPGALLEFARDVAAGD